MLDIIFDVASIILSIVTITLIIKIWRQKGE